MLFLKWRARRQEDWKPEHWTPSFPPLQWLLWHWYATPGSPLIHHEKSLLYRNPQTVDFNLCRSKLKIMSLIIPKAPIQGPTYILSTTSLFCRASQGKNVGFSFILPMQLGWTFFFCFLLPLPSPTLHAIHLPLHPPTSVPHRLQPCQVSPQHIPWGPVLSISGWWRADTIKVNSTVGKKASNPVVQVQLSLIYGVISSI